MKKLILIVIISLEVINLKGQSATEASIQNKYWVYRDRLRKQFTKIGVGEGKSLTADKIALNKGRGEYKGKLNFGDVMAFHADYLGILASEYWLLNNEGKDTKATLNELYFSNYSANKSFKGIFSALLIVKRVLTVAFILPFSNL